MREDDGSRPPDGGVEDGASELCRRCDAATESVAVQVVTGVADVHDVAPTSLAPLMDTIDPEALDRLLRSDHERPGSPCCKVSFCYERTLVTVYSDGLVRIRNADDPPPEADLPADPGWFDEFDDHLL